MNLSAYRRHCEPTSSNQISESVERTLAKGIGVIGAIMPKGSSHSSQEVIVVVSDWVGDVVENRNIGVDGGVLDR